MVCSSLRPPLLLRTLLTLGAGLAALASAACSATGTARSTPTTERLERAVAIALDASTDARSGDEHRVTGATERILDGRYIWRVTLKPVNLLPADPAASPVGLGGEIFVDVDLAANSSELRFGQ